MSAETQQGDAKVEARAAVDTLSRDGVYFVLGGLIELHPESVLKCIRIYRTVLGDAR